MAAPKLKKRLGDLLVEEEIISEDQLMAALSAQKETGRKLGTVLIDSGTITEEQLLRFLAQQLNLPFLNISDWQIEERLASELSEVHARRLRAIILESDESIIEGMYEAEKYKIIDGAAVEQTLEEDIRTPRNVLLAESDWTQLPDSPLTDAKKTEWATYRQALRDLPASTDDPIVWPTQPE